MPRRASSALLCAHPLRRPGRRWNSHCAGSRRCCSISTGFAFLLDLLRTRGAAGGSPPRSRCWWISSTLATLLFDLHRIRVSPRSPPQTRCRWWISSTLAMLVDLLHARDAAVRSPPDSRLTSISATNALPLVDLLHARDAGGSPPRSLLLADLLHARDLHRVRVSPRSPPHRACAARHSTSPANPAQIAANRIC
jgi:hypothetical protein